MSCLVVVGVVVVVAVVVFVAFGVLTNELTKKRKRGKDER